VTRRRAGEGGQTPFLLFPPALLGVLFLAVPALALVIRAPWSSLAQIYRDNDVLTALRISIVTSVEATVVSLLLGVPLAWVLARVRIPGIRVVRAFVLLPLVLPPLVGGIALLLALGRNGIVGRYLDSWFGIDLPFTQHGIVIAQTFVAMPFLVITMEAAFRAGDRGLEEAAATLGARRGRVFTRVTLPLVLPSIVAGTVLCWARALGEFGATILFGGNNPGTTQTMTTELYSAFNAQPQDAVALSLVLMLVAVIIICALRDRWLRPGAVS
jgi:molybdate transport system permease protein